jgi:CMP-N-acetylneuraminic acid synthetase
MYKGMKVVAIIPARGGSKSIPRKNIRPLAGKPLLAYTIEASLKSKYVDSTLVSTEDAEIAAVAKQHGAEVVDRPEELAMDDTPTLPVLKHAVGVLEKAGTKMDAVVLLQPTSPLRGAREIDEAVEKFFDAKADLVLSVSEAKHHPFWSFGLENGRLVPFVKGGFDTKKRQDLPKVYVPNGAIYVMAPEALDKESIYEGNVQAVIMAEEKSIDIDTMLDFKMAELLMKEAI